MSVVLVEMLVALLLLLVLLLPQTLALVEAAEAVEVQTPILVRLAVRVVAVTF
jgi:hypothetical protein